MEREMAKPSSFRTTPRAGLTVAIAYSNDSAAEVWQQIPGNLFVVRAGVPADIAANLLQLPDAVLDAAIQTMLGRGYQMRVSS
jgi:hypothetical protein